MVPLYWPPAATDEPSLLPLVPYGAGRDGADGAGVGVGVVAATGVAVFISALLDVQPMDSTSITEATRTVRSRFISHTL
jgi:hypothetical protein